MKIEVSPNLAWYLIDNIDPAREDDGAMRSELEAFMGEVRAVAATPAVKRTGKATMRCCEPLAHKRDALCGAECANGAAP